MRLLLLLPVVALAGATARFLVWPEEDAPGRADAIVVLAGDAEHRVAEGLRLAARGVALTLVLSTEPDPDYPRGLCKRANVVCFSARPYSTTGEAESFGRIARRRGWRSIVLVTSRYHVTRARLLFDRCFNGEVRAVGVDAVLDDYIRGAAWEWPKLGHALLVKRDC